VRKLRIKDVVEVTNNIIVKPNDSLTSAEIEDIISQSLKWDSRIDDALIDVKVNSRVVTLSGSVASLHQKRLAV